MPGLTIGVGIAGGSAGGRARRLAASASSFSPASPPGTPIATLTDPFGGGAAFSVVGTPPAVLALADDGRIVAGRSAASAGASYTLVVRATKLLRAVEEPLTFVAAGAPSTLAVRRQATFGASPAYMADGVPSTRAALIDDGAGGMPAFDANGLLLLERPTVNFLADPTFATTTIGVGDGPLGANYAKETGGQTTETLAPSPAKAGRKRFHVYHSGTPTAATAGIVTAWATIPTLARGTLLAQIVARIVSMSGAASGLQLGIQTRKSDGSATGSTIVSTRLTAGGTDAQLATALLAAVPGGHDQYRLRIQATLSSMAAYDIVFEVEQPQVEDGLIQTPLASAITDITSFVAGARTTAPRILLPAGTTADVYYSALGGGRWFSAAGDTAVPTGVGTKKVAGFSALATGATPFQKNDHTLATYPPEFLTTLGTPADFRIYESNDVTSPSVRWYGDPARADSLKRAANRVGMVLAEARSGDNGTNDPPGTHNRAEVTPQVNDPIHFIDFDQEFWFSTWYAIQTDAPSSEEFVIYQIHDTPDNADLGSRSPPLAVRFRYGNLEVTTLSDTAATTTVDPMKVLRATVPDLPISGLSQAPVFNRLAVRARLSRSGHGQLAVWHSTGSGGARAMVQLFASNDVPMGYNDTEVDGGRNFPKWGLYRTPPTSATSRVVHVPRAGFAAPADPMAPPPIA